MKLSRITTLLTVTLSIFISTQAVAADRGVFASKSQKQHELSNWEENKLKAEFKSRFNSASSGAFQKLNNNPWEAKRSKQKQHNQKMLELSNSWGACREFAYKQRGQCYARGGDAYTCERYYDARSNHCDQNF